jgi:hypothetical protein
MISVQPDQDKNRIEELKKSLYSRNAPDVRTRRKLRFTDKPATVPTDWEHPSEGENEPVVLNTEYQDRHHMSFFTKLLIASAVFCVLAVSIGAFIFFNGANLISANNIDIQITGPVSIAGGEPVTFDITAKNNNNVDLQVVDMNVEFPAGTTDPDNPAQTLSTYRSLIGDMSAGSSAHKTIRAIMFGEENLQKEILVSLTYSIKGSTAVFTKTQTYDVLISSSPINVTVSSFKEITSGQEFDLKVDLKSNSEQTLKNVLLKASYPFGYNFISSNLPPLADNATWRIGDIPAGAKKSIVIHGSLSGEDSDVRAFHFTVGAQSTKDPKSIATQYSVVEQDMTIQKPFISLNIAIENDSTSVNHVGKFGEPQRVEITWFNNLPNAVSNVEIKAKLAGSAYDKNMVTADQGFFNSSSDEIVWNEQTNRDLASMPAGASGKVSFTITPSDKGSASNPVVNPTITIVANVSGNRTQESHVPQALAGAVTRAIRVSSNVNLSGRVVRTVGPFPNTGPIPPKAEQATTYTVIWDVDNTSSTVGNAQVTALLPAYVKWLSVVSPSSEDVSYDSHTGQITWNIGNVSTYTLTSSHRRELAFQISLTPSVSQVGQSPILVNQTTLSAQDTFTGAQLKSSQDTLTTRFSTDPAYQNSQETVVR